jgi:hypothetical protein
MSSFFSSESYFLEEGGELRPPLIELLQLDNLYEDGDGLKEAVHKTQKHWLGVVQGRDGRERVDMVDSTHWQLIENDVFTCLEKLGLAQGKSPLLKKYNYAFLYGGFVKAMRYRLRELIEDWKNGISFDELVVLTGERPLRDWWVNDFLGSARNESEAAELLLKEAELPFSCKITYISVPMIGNLRPSTGDTIRAWLETNPKGGTILAPSHPIVFAYQDLVAKNILGKDFFIDTTGKPAVRGGGGYVSLIFDTIAKSLYEIKNKYPVGVI